MDASLWREPYLVEHTFQHLYGVLRSLIDPPLDVLDLGCGTGYMALELAREGCRVVGVDSDRESIEVAERARDADPMLRDRPALSDQVSDFTEWEAPGESFDIVVAARVLHHVPHLEDLAAKKAGWLRPYGRLVCVEFAYDRFDDRAAAWLYQMRGLLQAAGLSSPDDHLGTKPEAGSAKVWEDWWKYHQEDHELNTFEELVGALRAQFAEEHLDWHPYLYWEVLDELDAPPDVGARVARFVLQSEEHLITNGSLPGVLFSWVGRPEPRS